MTALSILPPGQARWDCAALGEVMLRLDPGEVPVARARSFRVWEGGGEYNVARGLARVFGLRTTIVTALVDNAVGRLLEDLMLAGGVDLSHVRWLPFDGVGREARNPLNFTERGFGVRAPLGCSDRAHSAASRLAPGDIDWEALFGNERVRWFHTGGIFAALSSSTADLAAQAMATARRHGTVISYDLNYRQSLWQASGGADRAREVNRELVSRVDVLVGNEEDFIAALGFEVDGVDEQLSALDPAGYARMVEAVVREFPNLRVVATTLRTAHTATRNDWGALLWADGELFQAGTRENLEVFDRVGGGDSFVSGLAFAFLAGMGPADAVEWGTAHGALAMTTPGDTSMVTAEEVARVARGGPGRIRR